LRSGCCGRAGRRREPVADAGEARARSGAADDIESPRRRRRRSERTVDFNAMDNSNASSGMYAVQKIANKGMSSPWCLNHPGAAVS
jgi:hypothetical protein